MKNVTRKIKRNFKNLMNCKVEAVTIYNYQDNAWIECYFDEDLDSYIISTHNNGCVYYEEWNIGDIIKEFIYKCKFHGYEL